MFFNCQLIISILHLYFSFHNKLQGDEINAKVFYVLVLFLCLLQKYYIFWDNVMYLRPVCIYKLLMVTIISNTSGYKVDI